MNFVFHECKKYIEIDCHHVRDKIEWGLIKTFHMNNQYQVVDFLPKALDANQLEFLLSKLGIMEKIRFDILDKEREYISYIHN